MALRDAFRFAEAAALLEQSLAAQQQLRVGKREMARTRGNLGELRTIRGALTGAEEALLRPRPRDVGRAGRLPEP